MNASDSKDRKMAEIILIILAFAGTLGLGVFFWAIASAEELPTDSQQTEDLQWSLDND